MPPDVFLINRNDPKTIELLASVKLPTDEIKLMATINHYEKRAELTDRRKALRYYLSQRMGLTPDLVPLLKGPTGQVLVDGLYVSVASRGNYIAVAIGNHSLGVDIETSIETLPLAVLHPSEIESLEKAKDRPLRAAMIWAAKESAWKALALPFTIDPTSLGVCLKDSGEFTVKFTHSVALKGQVKWHAVLQAAVAYCERCTI